MAHAIIDVASSAPLFLSSKSVSTSPFDTSPAEPGRASLASSGNWENALFQLKIRLRQRDAQQNGIEQPEGSDSPQKKARLENSVTAALAATVANGGLPDEVKSNRNLLGRDDLTVRFRFNQ